MRTPTPSTGSPPLPALDSEPGPAVARAPEVLQAMSERIVERAAYGTRSRPGRARQPLWLAAAVALGFVSAGTVLAAVGSWPALRAYFAPSAQPPKQAPAHSAPTPKLMGTPTAEPESDSDTGSDSNSEPGPDTGSVSEPGSDSVAGRPAAGRAHRPVAARISADLLARANQLRAEQRWSAAESLYLRVLDQNAGADARGAAALAAAELRLNQLRDPRAALALFQRALALQPNGVLAEQARHGIAQSYRALGDPAKERAALQAFVDAHPQSPMRARALARLHVLDAAR